MLHDPTIGTDMSNTVLPGANDHRFGQEHMRPRQTCGDLLRPGAAFASMVALCFAARVQRRRFGLPSLSPRQAQLHRLAGVGLAALSLYAAWSRDGAAFGLML